MNRDSMGKFQSGSNSQIIQEVDNQVGGTTGQQAPERCFLTPTFWQQNVYFTGNNDVIKAFQLDPTMGKLSSTPTSHGSFNLVFPGAQPVVSSNGPATELFGLSITLLLWPCMGTTRPIWLRNYIGVQDSGQARNGQFRR